MIKTFIALIIGSLLLTHSSEAFEVTDPIKELKIISQINDLKNQAEEALSKNDFEKAKDLYAKIILKYKEIEKTPDAQTFINYGHLSMKTKKYDDARNYYNAAINDENISKELSSIAYQQLGVLTFRQMESAKNLGDKIKIIKDALAFTRQSLLKNHNNQNARKNYEILLQYLKDAENQKKQEDQKGDQDKDGDQDKKEDKKDKGDNKEEGDKGDQGEKGKNEEKGDQGEKSDEDKKGDQEEKEEKDGEKGENGTKEEKGDQEKDGEKKGKPQGRSKEDLKKALEKINFNEAKAKQLLNAMKNREIQYLQQMRKQGKKKKNDEPDW